LGVSKWTVFDYLAAGYIRALELPALRPRPGDRPKRRLRRSVIDRRELDRFLDGFSGHTQGTPLQDRPMDIGDIDGGEDVQTSAPGRLRASAKDAANVS
jgi:hypothetical protein